MPEVISQEAVEQAPDARACAYRILRYAPNLVRDEWVNIGVLVFDPATGERRLRLIEEAGEFARVRRLHPAADEAVLRDRKSTRLNSSHLVISYAGFCFEKKKKK